jgi:hypothetical protein
MIASHEVAESVTHYVVNKVNTRAAAFGLASIGIRLTADTLPRSSPFGQRGKVFRSGSREWGKVFPDRSRPLRR